MKTPLNMKQLNFTNNESGGIDQVSGKQKAGREQAEADGVELQKIIAGCLQQNRKHQKMLYKAFYCFAMGICLRYAANRYEAAQIVNQGFLKIFTNLHKFDTDRPIIHLFGRIMINTSVDYYRSNLKLSLNEDPDVTENIDHNDLPDQNLNYHDLLGMLQQLPNGYRIVFNLFAIEGFSHEEISTELEISTDTSRSNLFKAREKLKIMILNSGRLRGESSEEARH
jgi:RNA polymerase sigma factor (sigma-70 family)